MGSGNRFFCDEHADARAPRVICLQCSEPATRIEHYDSEEDRAHDRLLDAIGTVLRGYCGARSGEDLVANVLKEAEKITNDEEEEAKNRADSLTELRRAADYYFGVCHLGPRSWK